MEFDDITHYPTEKLNPTAIAICRSHGSMAETVSDISKGNGDHCILKMIQKAIDKVNKGASCKHHKVRNDCICLSYSIVGCRLLNGLFWIEISPSKLESSVSISIHKNIYLYRIEYCYDKC